MCVFPMKDCGICGEKTCNALMERVEKKQKSLDDCPFYREASPQDSKEDIREANFASTDTHGIEFDFLLKPVHNEISARKLVRPFNGNLIELLAIKAGDVVMGRPMGAGCPVTHILKVYDVDPWTGVLSTWSIGPKIVHEGIEVKDIRAYSMVGFEGIATNIVREPMIGKVSLFMPSFCMIRLTHYGLVNILLDTKDGIFVRLEDIHIARGS